MQREGVFPRAQGPEDPLVALHTASPRIKGELVDRLLEKIALLELKLEEKGDGKERLIKSAREPSRPSSAFDDDDDAAHASPSAAAAPARSAASFSSGVPNKDLLQSLGDPDRPSNSPTMAAAAALGSSSSDWFSNVSSWVRQRTSTVANTSALVGHPGATLSGLPPLPRQSQNHQQQPQQQQQQQQQPREWQTNGGSDAVAGSTQPRTSASRRTTNASAGSSGGTGPGAGYGGGMMAGGGGLSTASSTWGAIKNYSRYVTAAEDDAARESDDEARHQAMGEALAEANERLLEKELARSRLEAECRSLQQRVAEAEAAVAECERLKEENLEAWKAKYDLESTLATMNAQLEGVQRERDGLAQDLEAMRRQMAIWQDRSAGDSDKSEREGKLLQEQLDARGAELAALRGHTTEVEADRDRAVQERQRAQQERAKAVEERDKAVAVIAQVASLQAALMEAQATVAAAGAAAAEWKDNFLKERAVRRQLHEQLQVVRGNIRVMARVRPPQPCARSVINFPLEGLLTLQDPTSCRHREFEFDAVFGPDADQGRVFAEVLPLVRSCADGYNVCIFAYGQTGSGKTFTMQGPTEDPGINTRTLQELFRIAAEEPDRTWSFSVAVLEIYNEAVHDLLALSSATGGSGAPGQDAVARCTRDVSALGAGELPPNMDRVQALLWRPVSTPDEVQDALREGGRARRTASTALNAVSSRSHALVSVKVRNMQEGRPVTTLMHLVDLAGSERIERSEVTGEQLKEAQAINKSLSALGDVISALQRRTPHIPFRNSKLTQVLQDSLCGSSKVMLVCNLSPEAISTQETLSSLNFASRAAQVELGPVKRVTADKQASSGGAAGASEGGGDARPSSACSSPTRGPSGLRTSRLGDRASPVPSVGGSPRPSGSFAKPARH